MTQPVPQPVYVRLGAEYDDRRIVVELEAYVKFSAEIDASLAQLEAQFKSFAPSRTPDWLKDRSQLQPE